MKKKILCLALTAVMVVGTGMTADAVDFQGKDGWLVEFAGKKMESNFASSDVTDEATNVQPGDSITLKVNLKNSDKDATDWYMTNEVLETLEDAKAQANGGGYEYRLSYLDAAGSEKILYDSETVGGEVVSQAGEGLHEATDSLEDYFYLDRLAKGESASVRLRLAVDGETQGNGYQETFAKLKMNFAAENVPASTTTTKNRVVRKTVKTGDNAKVMLFSALALASGLLLLVLGIRSMKSKKRKNRKGE